MKKIKLSDKQKEVIKKMKLGWKFQTCYSRPMLFKNGKSIYYTYNLVDKLRDAGLLTIDTSDNEKLFFHLTELGKTIQL